EAIGDAELYVDANGAFTAKDAIRWAHEYVQNWNVRWFEEPVSSADFAGLRLVREHSLLDVAAGEYAYVPADFRNLLGCVDCLQADITRCGGITGPLRTAALRARPVRRRSPSTSRVLPRPHAHRVDAVRRRARTGRRRPRPRPLTRGPRARAEARGGAAVGGMILKLLKNIREGRVQKLLSVTAAMS